MLDDKEYNIECDMNIRNKRCVECIRPICQRDYSKLNKNANRWEDIIIPDIYFSITEYKTHDLYLG